MISVEEALRTVLENSGEPRVLKVPAAAASGAVLAEDIHSDIDMPPFDRSAMDGFAMSGDGRTYQLQGEITAGNPGPDMVKPGFACPIMTGAPVPEGADRVAVVEDSVVEGSILHLQRVPPEGANICWKGEDIKEGEMVLEHGTRLYGQHLGIAAMAGRFVLSVYRRPAVALVTTGTEVIPPNWIPSPGKVRNANLPLMVSQLSMNGFPPVAALHSADDPGSLRETYSQLLEGCDVLITAGGVSKGTRDYVPSVLESLEVELLFRSVAQKPGKPLTFGVGPRGQAVFGLPGNPVSVLVSMEEYVLPLLRKSSGFKGYRKRVYHGRLMSDYSKKPGRLNYLRVIAYREGDEWKLHHPDSSGSGDLMSAVNVNALALAGEDRTSISSGETLPFHFLGGTAGELSFA